jgi:glycosyltransferase involved in cell wall biosynthesis
MLGDRFDLDLILDGTGDPPPHPLRKYYTIRDYAPRPAILETLSFLHEFRISCQLLCRYIRDDKPDMLFHITKPQTYGLAVAIIGRWFKVPFVIRNGGDILNAYKDLSGLRKWYIWIRVTLFASVAFRLAPSIITIGRRLRDILAQRGIDHEKIHVIPQPIDRERFYPATDKHAAKRLLGVPIDKAMVLFVGRMTKIERVGIFPSVIEQVRTNDPDFLFFFIGKPSSYATKLKEAGGHSVRVVGRVSHETIPAYYRAADLLIHLSTSEGSVPNSILEALACSLPICANQTGEIDTVTSHVFSTSDEFAHFMLGRDWEAEQVPEAFEWNALRDRYVSCFDQVLEAPT